MIEKLQKKCSWPHAKTIQCLPNFVCMLRVLCFVSIVTPVTLATWFSGAIESNYDLLLNIHKLKTLVSCYTCPQRICTLALENQIKNDKN